MTKRARPDPQEPTDIRTMNNKLTKPLLRIWLSLASIATFATGWAMLAHAPKPAPLMAPPAEVTSLTLPELQPIPGLQELRNGRPASPSISINRAVGFPRLRARGS